MEEVDHLLQTSTPYLSHDLLKVMEARCRHEGVPPNTNRYVDTDSAFPYWLETSKNSLLMNLDVDRYLPYINQHRPALSETTKGVREDEYGNEEVSFPTPDDLRLQDDLRSQEASQGGRAGHRCEQLDAEVLRHL